MALPVLSDSTAATVMAGGLIDGGAALYSYAKGEEDVAGFDKYIETYKAGLAIEQAAVANKK